MRAAVLVWVLLSATTALAQAPSSAPLDRSIFCGDGVLNRDFGEECDQGVRNSDTAPNACRKSCRLPRCGDGALDSGETCDDGNTFSGDSCPASCVRQSDLAAREVEAPASSPVRPPRPPRVLSPERAFELAVGLSLYGPPGLGLIYGPSAGHFYAGEYSRAALTSSARLGLALAGFFSARAVVFGDIKPGVGAILLGGCGAGISILALTDILDASAAVRRRLAR